MGEYLWHWNFGLWSKPWKLGNIFYIVKNFKMQFLKNGPAKSLDFNCSDLQRMSTLWGYESPSCPIFSILPSAVRTVWEVSSRLAPRLEAEAAVPEAGVIVEMLHGQHSLLQSIVVAGNFLWVWKTLVILTIAISASFLLEYDTHILPIKAPITTTWTISIPGHKNVWRTFLLQSKMFLLHTVVENQTDDFCWSGLEIIWLDISTPAWAALVPGLKTRSVTRRAEVAHGAEKRDF